MLSVHNIITFASPSRKVEFSVLTYRRRRNTIFPSNFSHFTSSLIALMGIEYNIIMGNNFQHELWVKHSFNNCVSILEYTIGSCSFNVEFYDLKVQRHKYLWMQKRIFKLLSLLYTYEYFACMHVCLPCECLIPKKARRGLWIPCNRCITVVSHNMGAEN